MAKKRHYGSNMTSDPVPNVVSKMRSGEHYAGHAASKAMRHHDGMMINDDMSAPANLPTHVIDKYWAPRAYALDEGVPGDLFRGVQRQLSEDASDFKREFEPKKY